MELFLEGRGELSVGTTVLNISFFVAATNKTIVVVAIRRQEIAAYCTFRG
jgi:hypothetical protein